MFLSGRELYPPIYVYNLIWLQKTDLLVDCSRDGQAIW